VEKRGVLFVPGLSGCFNVLEQGHEPTNRVGGTLSDVPSSPSKYYKEKNMVSYEEKHFIILTPDLIKKTHPFERTAEA
jgi:hypothetical protein